MRGAIWTFMGFGSRQVLRFANNLILTRLLFPELFGLMALVNIFLLGLNLFSDIGIIPSIIQNKRGNDPVFLNTAWTLQILRGLVLGVIACLIALPASRFYDEPLLLYVLPVAGLAAVFQGFNSTKKATANRQLRMRELMIIEVGSYVIGLVIMVTWAWLHPTIWALVVGGLVTAFLEMVLSHVALVGQNNRIQWEWEAIHELYRFGRWIFFSTALTFLAAQSDRLVIGKLIDTHFLGIYAIALMLARMADDAIKQLGFRVLFPSYSTLQREDPAQLYGILRQTRVVLIGLSWIASFIFIFLGDDIVRFLYDDRYVEAGWMLQVLAAGTLVGVIGVTYDNVLIAKGKTFAVAALNGLYLVILITAIFMGNRYYGQQGLVLGIAAVGWLIYPFKALWLARLKLWQAEIDLPAIGIATIVVVLLYFFM
jgi:O-antigen/teichoic acid export membrane protein